MGIRRVKAIEVKPAAISGEAVSRQDHRRRGPLSLRAPSLSTASSSWTMG